MSQLLGLTAFPRGVTMKRFQPTLKFWVKKNKVSSDTEPNGKSTGSIQSHSTQLLQSILLYEIVAGPSHSFHSDESDSLPAVASGDDEPSIDAEDHSVLASSYPEEGCSSTTTSLTPSQSDSTPLDISILLKNGTLSTLSQSMNLKLLDHTPDAKYKYPTKYMNGCNRRF